MTQAETRDDQHLLETVEHSVLRLLSGFRDPPARLEITAGAVTVTAEWAAGEGVGGTVPAAPAAPAAPARAATDVPDTPADDRLLVRAPTVGVFYRAPQPGSPPFVQVGDQVAAGQQIGIVEAMKLMIPVTVDVPGAVLDVLVADGAAVEYDTPLVVLSATEAD
ncbi:acetyl-CoA carboxylase biotin carboxyl carrier protein [Micromonospora chokoriensis]|uniref:Biotin carboxyl carrier protein of acetyl-CoA carboxylase n=1 Tax=Micromonospora chokoriensis TaxID=356851 RepID=A0A1C4XG31_9ACTN|nr:biotin/lipoyl-containing protein [Micromonospora chokoriensis]SCF07490.1 acetyl-CoA carboxylase biotin carboxyl carrier protein [Micromonospora chokoriensis]